MTTETTPLESQHNEDHDKTPPSQAVRDVKVSKRFNLPPIAKDSHNNSLISFSNESTLRIPNPSEKLKKLSTSTLKNKALLVPARLALKRQRAVLRPTSLAFEPILPSTLQLELGNPEELLTHVDRDDEENTAHISRHLNPLRDNPIPSTSNLSSPLRGDTPHTVPTDISLLYREKPSFAHPITGSFIVPYSEENGGPSPCSYVLPRKSCREKNAPAFSFGTKCSAEKKGGSRTSWQKQWFAHSDPYTMKVDFNRENVWPTPTHYTPKPSLGVQATKVSFPSWSIAARLQNNPIVMVDSNNPAPDAYDTVTAFRKLKARNTQITLKSRPEGNQALPTQTSSKTPGPGTYDESKFLLNKCSAPKHSFGRRIQTSLGQDPYVNTLPSVKT